ncbi:PREDICTED: uncharacterized protein LOC106323578 [Brassica oleracea var. oleracea]|uniref:uncharacterized protein LOC106323578 n=1 Tax=Brassica oleracea var. oleracea TaxID=109376 RepID=UPI0006A6BBE4|nr:PREDICTED: uncharacterized protein LOC106323578 [Brassica oleracea var. oleracea]
MSRRLSYAEKGKGLQRPISPPRRGRVILPDFDTSELMRKHELTLIGRTTNPRAQRMWSLIPFFADHWKCKYKPFGADLGQGKFQFQFENHEDLQAVLDNGPYHFAKWMVIIQKWEPSISPKFPSQIPFWIQVQDVPVHLWNEAILRGIGEDIGTFDVWEITASKARFRAFINGLRPLIFKTTLEFANGDEVSATLLYEKLEKHCKICYMLDHEKEDCHLNKSHQSNKLKSHFQGNPQRKEETLPPRRSYSAKQGDKDPDSRQPNGFMRDARRTGFNHQPPPSSAYRSGNRTYDGGRRTHRTFPRASQDSSRTQTNTTRQRSEYEHGGSRWVDTGQRLPQSEYSQHRDKTRGSNVQAEETNGERMATSLLKTLPRSAPAPPVERA